MAEVGISESVDLDKLLGQLPVEMRSKILRRAVRNGGNVVARAARKLAPVGDLKHKPEKDALKDTIAVKAIAYRDENIHMAIVGPTYPEGNHGHLIEGGHEVKVSRGERKGQTPQTGSARVEGKEFMAPAIDQTKKQQEEAVIQTIQRAIKKQGG